MHYHPCQSVLVVIRRKVLFAHLFGQSKLSQILILIVLTLLSFMLWFLPGLRICLLVLLFQIVLRVWPHVQLMRELDTIIQLVPLHGVIVEFKAMQGQKHGVRETLHALPFQSWHLFIAFAAMVGVVAVQHIALNQARQGLCQIALVLHYHSQRL